MSSPEKRRRSDLDDSPGPFKRSNPEPGMKDTIIRALGKRPNPGPKVHSQKSKQTEVLAEKYERLQSQFLQQGLTQQFYFFLRRISGDQKVPAEIRRLPLLRSLCDTAKDLLLNELEIVVWAIYLEKYVWPAAKEEDLSEMLLYSAFAAKTYMNEDIQAFQQFIVKNKIASFNQVYNEWLAEHRQKMGIPPKELNKMYVYLNKSLQVDESASITDYNYYVDEILHNSTQYNSNAHKVQQDENYSDFMKILETYKADPNSIILDKRNPSYNIQEIPQIEEIPPMTQEESTLLKGVFLRADSVFNDSALPPDPVHEQEVLPPLEPHISSSSTRGLLVSQPALEKMESLITELERQHSQNDVIMSDPSYHHMQLRKNPSTNELFGPAKIELKKEKSFISSLFEN